MRIFILILFLSFTINAYATVYNKGGLKIETGNVLERGPDVYENEVAPTGVAIGTIWRDITKGIIFVWNGSAWVDEKLSQDIKDEIAIFRANINSISDPATKKCLKSLAVLLLKLYKE